MPDWNGLLEVTMLEQFRLDSIPMGWTLTVNGADSSQAVTRYSAEEGDTTMGWLNVYEGASVVLLPPTAEKPLVKKVTLEEVSSVEPAVDLDNTTTAWTDGNTFAVPAGGLTYSDAITVEGNVTLVLTDGETLALNKGISLASSATLTVEGTGTMNINGTDNNTSSTVAGTGTIVLTSGTLNAKGGNGAMVPMIETSSNPGGVAINGAVTVKGGTLTATGGTGGHLNTDGYCADARAGAGGAAISGDVIITDGTVTATSGNGGDDAIFSSDAIAGAGGAAIGGNVTLTGGTLTTVNGSAGTKRGDGTVGTGGAAVAGTVTDNR